MANGRSDTPELREDALRRVTELWRGGSAPKVLVDEVAKELEVDAAALWRWVREDARPAREQQLREVLSQARFKELTQAQPAQSTMQALLEALAAAKAERPSLFAASASERALCHRIAVCLESSLRRAGEPWDVDCEYNRLRSGQDDYEDYVAKALPIDGEDSNVYPDIVVHRRGQPDNRLVIEAKVLGRTNTTARNVRRDLAKLRLFRSSAEFSYEAAAFILLQVGHQPGYRVFTAE